MRILREATELHPAQKIIYLLGDMFVVKQQLQTVAANLSPQDC